MEIIVVPHGMPLGTILVADDDQEIRQPLEYLLRLQGYRVLTADDGVQALSLLEEEPVDVALLDVNMPRESGFSVCRAVKSRSATRLLPVVLMARLGGGAEDRIHGIEAGADDFLSKPIRKEELLARVKSLLRLKRIGAELEMAETVLLTLAASIEAKDPYTAGHCERVSLYSAGLAGQLGLPEDQRLALRLGGMIHDIGKVAVPDQILLKPGPLNAEERRLMEMHTSIGEQICAPMKSFRNILPIIRSHHEHQNGSGYPDHLTGDQIPLTARILQIADVYDALTTDRPYRAALTSEQALSTVQLEAERGWWDRELVSELESLLQNSAELTIAPLVGPFGQPALLGLRYCARCT
jgi:putative two-component system response regulator